MTKTPFLVNKYTTLREFEDGLNWQLTRGYILHSWNIDKDWGIVAIFVPVNFCKFCKGKLK